MIKPGDMIRRWSHKKRGGVIDILFVWAVKPPTVTQWSHVFSLFVSGGKESLTALEFEWIEIMVNPHVEVLT